MHMGVIPVLPDRWLGGIGPGSAQAVEAQRRVRSEPHTMGLSPGRQFTILNLGFLVPKVGLSHPLGVQ